MKATKNRNLNTSSGLRPPSPQSGEGRDAIEAVKADRYVTRVELARILKVSVRKVDSMIAEKEIPVIRLGKAVRFRLEDVERRLDEAMEAESEQKEIQPGSGRL